MFFFCLRMGSPGWRTGIWGIWAVNLRIWNQGMEDWDMVDGFWIEGDQESGMEHWDMGW